MRGADPKPNPARVETFPRVARSFKIFVLRFEAGEVFVKGVIMGAVDVVGQLERRERVVTRDELMGPEEVWTRLVKHGVQDIALGKESIGIKMRS